jgi:hypothetical protein
MVRLRVSQPASIQRLDAPVGPDDAGVEIDQPAM